MQALSTENHHLHNQLADTRQALTELGTMYIPPCKYGCAEVHVKYFWYCFFAAELTVQKLQARQAQQVATSAATFSGKRKYGDETDCGSVHCVLSHRRHSGGKADKPQQGKVIPGAAGKKTLSSSFAGVGKATVGKTPPGKTAVETMIEKTNVTTGGSQPAASTFTKVFVCPSLSLLQHSIYHPPILLLPYTCTHMCIYL